MSLRLNRAWLVLGLIVAGDVWALGLGDIRLNSALNEPLRAEIQLLSATPEELESLRVQLASAATFERYGVDRPFYLTRLQFAVVEGRGANASVVRVTSAEPLTEPFVTFLVEASWAQGRLLREYTMLLDPPTFAPAPSAAAPVAAPSRATPSDSGRIERPGSSAQPTSPTPTPSAAGPAAGGDVYVQRGDTLWEIASRARPDNRLSMNQMLLAIYEANPQAFSGNLNRLNAGATLRIPGAEDIFRINRGDAFSEVQRHNSAWSGAMADSVAARPSLTLVPPDPAEATGDRGDGAAPGRSPDGGAAAAERIRALEQQLAEQSSLLEIRDNELAQLRSELARLREARAEAEPASIIPADEPVVEAEPVPVDPDELFIEDETMAGDEEATAVEPEPAAAALPERSVPAAASRQEPGVVDRIVGVLTGFWGILGVVLLLVLAILVWLARRAAGRADEDSTGVWESLDDDDDLDSESRASTERLRALARDDDSAIVVVEQESDRRRTQRKDDSFSEVSAATSSTQKTLEDTFSSETAINLDQSDPVAEADFHMAYGLYDQAADLIDGALAVEPERQDLMAKLCEIYFVWGNQSGFIEAATRLHDQLGGESTPDWEKIVIMGQQIAAEHRLFAGASAAGAATRAVDLSFDVEDEGGALDMDFAGGPDGEVSHVIDLGGDDDSSRDDDDDALDFMFDDAAGDEPASGATTVREVPKRSADEATVESPTIESPAQDRTVESPTIERSFERPMDDVDGTSELPSIGESDDYASRFSGDATAEIDLDDLGLDLEDLARAGLEADVDDDLAANSDFDEAASFDDAFDDAFVDQTGDDEAQADLDATGRNEALARDDVSSADEASAATSEMPALDEATGRSRAVGAGDDASSTDVDVDASLLEATGFTQVLGADNAVGRDEEAELSDSDRTLLARAADDDAETMLASLDDLDRDLPDEQHTATAALNKKDVDGVFDFAKTEALPKEAYQSADETGEMPVDLDLDDLTNALRYSEGDTVDQPRDDATVEQPVARRAGTEHQFIDLDFGDLDGQDDDGPTAAISPDELSEDLHDARTMTEVGTKLDLARAYVDMGDPDGARSILEEVLDEGDDGQRQQAQKLIDTLPA